MRWNISLAHFFAVVKKYLKKVSRRATVSCQLIFWYKYLWTSISKQKNFLCHHAVVFSFRSPMEQPLCGPIGYLRGALRLQDSTPGEQHCRTGTPYCLATLSVNVQLRGTSAAVGTGTITALELLTVQYVSLRHRCSKHTLTGPPVWPCVVHTRSLGSMTGSNSWTRTVASWTSVNLRLQSPIKS